MPKKINNQLKLTTPDLVVLSLLSECPTHGYDINQELERRDVQDWASVSRPQVYYSLKKLKALDMIIEVTDPARPEGPERQIYKITSKGKMGLTNSLGDDHWGLHRPISSFLTWMALSPYATRASINHVIHERRKFLEKEVKRERLTLKSFDTESGNMIIPAILMVELTIKQFEIELEWLKKVEKSLLKTSYK